MSNHITWHNVIFLIFFNAQHALCIWHIDKNFVKNCKSSFDDEESWKAFFKHWHNVMYAEIETIYEEIWKSLQNKYEKNYWSAVNYLRDELLTRWVSRIMKCFINKTLSFDNTTTSKAEDEHSQLKRALKSSVEDLKKMIKIIELMLKNQKNWVFDCSWRSEDARF